MFWVYGVALGTIGYFGSLAVELGAAMSSGVVGTPSVSTWFMFYYVWLAVAECYWVWLGVSLWRCAFNVRGRILGYCAKVLAVTVVISSLATLYANNVK